VQPLIAIMDLVRIIAVVVAILVHQHAPRCASCRVDVNVGEQSPAVLLLTAGFLLMLACRLREGGSVREALAAMLTAQLKPREVRVCHSL
jgi:hypothetical protein